MTVSRSDNSVKANCNGSVVDFTFEFPIIQSSDLVVTLVNTTTGEETVLVENTNYVVAAADGGYDEGGTVTTQAAGESGMEDYAYATGYQVLIERSVPKTQLTDLRTGQSVDLQDLEDALDKIQMQVIDMQNQVSRCVQIPTQDGSLTTELVSAALRAEKYLYFDEDGNAQASSGPIVGITPTTYAESLLGAADAGEARALLGDYLPPGVITPYGGSTAPTGWLLCYGQAVSRTTYADLFTILSTTYGVGDGSTTFNVPDLRGRFPLGKDNMGGSSANRVTDTDADTLGGADGDETKSLAHTHTTGDVTLTTAQIPDHTHGVNGNPGGGGSGTYRALSGDSNTVTEGSTLGMQESAGGSAHNHGATGSGGSATQDIMPPFITLNYIIKT